MNKIKLRYLLISILIIGASLYYYISFGDKIDTTFLSISTFIFSIFTGFFISQQSSRQRSVRDKVADMNGQISFIYRTSQHLGGEYQKSIGEIIKKNYNQIIETKSWSNLFSKKTTLLTDIHAEVERALNDENIPSNRSSVFTRILGSLSNLQQDRKTLIALLNERIPISQWMLVYILMAILIISLSTLPSQFLLTESILKAGFVTTVIFVAIILRKLDHLSLYENLVGESSAKDVLEIIEGSK